VLNAEDANIVIKAQVSSRVVFLPSRTLFPTHTFPELRLNKMTNGLVTEKLQAECLLIGSEQVCFTSAGTAKKTAREWINRDHQKYWEFLPGHKETEEF
jgi:hypothetical protein